MNAIRLESYNEVYLEKSWHWLNDPEIKCLTNTRSFTKDDQQKWFHALAGRSDYKLWGVSYNAIPIGVFGIKNIENGSGEYWGYIGEKEYWGKGLGPVIIGAIIDQAKQLNLKRLYLKVIGENVRAIKLYRKMGFQFSSKEEGLMVFTKQL
ncbi:GNAT family N-acetyltransferase [Niabella sp.]|uniref:GNAT family N-acetyltransferase n=1 Tax=Niabella sp. TaxID=1962976 RepID=UPI002636D1C8|nr:GNAT family N-acetyltransferase [Niabella sp.]